MLYQLNLSGGTGGTSGQTVYTARNGVVVTSSFGVYYNSNYYYMGYLFDGIDDSAAFTTYWLSNGGTTVTLDFDFFSILTKIHYIHKMILYPRTRDDSISDYRILGSDDKTLWTELIPRVYNTYDNCSFGTAREHVVDQKYRYIRLEIYRNGSWGATMNGVKFIVDAEEDYSDTVEGQAYPTPDYGWSRVEDTSPHIWYKRNNPYGGIIHYNAEEISFSFEGTRLRLIYNYNMGNSGDIVYIDGVAYPTYRHGTGVPTLVFSITGLERRKHTVVIKTYVGSDWYSQFNALEIDSDSVMGHPLGVQLLTIDKDWQRCSETQLTYPNGYMAYSSTATANMHGGSARILTLATGQDTIRFRFYGSRLRILGCTFPARNDNMKIIIDGSAYYFTSNYPTANIGQVVVFEKLTLAKGLHDVIITFGETSNGGQFFMDAVDINSDGYILGELGTSLPLPEIGWERHDNLQPQFKYSGTWVQRTGSGVGYYADTLATTNIAASKIEFSFIGTKLRIIGLSADTRQPVVNISLNGQEYTYSPRTADRVSTVILFEKKGLPLTRYDVVVSLPDGIINTGNDHFDLDAIDIDQDGRLLHPQEVLTGSELNIGNRIRCHYRTYRANELGVFSNFGEMTTRFLPTLPVTVPDGDFYFIAVEEDRQGRMKFIADRNIQGGISWQKLNDEGLARGRDLGRQPVATIPVMTSNKGANVSITPSAVSGTNYEAWKAFNGDSTAGDTNRWVVPNPAPAWLMFSFDKPRIIRQYSLQSHTYNAAAPTAWALQASVNGADWITIDSRTGEQGLLTRRYFRIDNHTGYLFYRFYVTANNGYTGYFLSLDEMQLYEETDGSLRTEIRLPTGGVSAADKDNDWDTNVVKSDLGGTATAGDTRVWNWSGSWSHTANTPGGIANRTVRGGTAAASLSSVTTTDVTLTSTGFRPVFVKENSYRGASSLLSEIEVRPWADIQTSLHIYRKEIIDPPVARLIDVTVPVTATDWKGYSIEVSGMHSEPHAGWLAFNNNLSDTYAWAPPAGMATGWLIFDYGVPLKIAGYGIASRPAYATQTPRNWTFYGSNDKENWVVLDSVFDAPAWVGGELRQTILKGQVFGKTFRYFKWEVSNPATGNQLGIQEFELYEVGVNAVEQRKTFINVPYRNDFKSTVFVAPHASMVANALVTPIYVNDFICCLQVKNICDLISHISISVQAQMRGTLSTTPPPMIQLKLSPVKDAFVRSKVPLLNYGEEQEMMIGTEGEEDFIGLIQFDIGTIPARQRLKSAYLQIYIEQSQLAGVPIGLYAIEQNWTEVGVTWASTPSYGRKLAELNAVESKAFAKENVLDIVRDWYNGTSVNQGLLLKAEQQLLNVYARLGTRERGETAAPQLVVEYYDPNVGSSGFADLATQLVSQQNKSKDIRISLTVKSTWDKTELGGSLKVFNPDMLESFLTVRRDNMQSKISVRRQNIREILSSVTARERREFILESRVLISRDFLVGKGTVRRWENRDQPAEIIVRRSDDSTIPSQLGVSRPNSMGSITIIYSAMLSSTLMVAKEVEDGIASSIRVRRSESQDVTSVIGVWANTQLMCRITVNSGYLASRLTVPYQGYKEMKTTLKVSERFASDLTAALEVIQGSYLTGSIRIEIYEDETYAFIM